MNDEPQIISIKLASDYIITINYNDGVKGDYNFSKVIEHDDLKALQDKAYFGTVKVCEKSGDLVWQNGESVCKDALYRQLTLRSMLNNLKIDEELL